jgi:predicted dehydrogenase
MAGGGALLDLGIYALQSVRYLTGQEPIEVNTTTYEPPDGGNTGPFRDVERNIVFDLAFATGMTATVTSGYTTRINRTQLTAEKGDLRLEPMMNYRGNRAYYTPKGGAFEEVSYNWAHHFALEMDDFAQCVLQNKQTRTPGEEGLRDIKIMLAAYESARTGKPVKLV